MKHLFAIVMCLCGTVWAQGNACLDKLADGLPDNAAAALRRIEGEDRQLLALRSYLRNRTVLVDRWSWSQEQIASYQRSAEYQAAQTELQKIAAHFAASNPGYTLYANAEVRSLDLQIERWNENESVGAAARELRKAVKSRRAPRGCSGDFAEFLTHWYPKRPPTLAAPGLSKHGQGRAFDFQVMRDGKIVAGTDSTRSISTWDRKGWMQKLHTAVTSASAHFSGPLKMPYEPWHYEYRPD